jgi:endo-1,4-beta-xylanase
MITSFKTQERFSCIYSKKMFATVLSFLLLIQLLTGNLTAQSKQLAPDNSRFIGAGTSVYYWRDFYKYWNQLSPGNDGKWGSVESVRGTYNWTNLEYLYLYANSTNLIFKEHVLVWGQQEPSWVASLDTASQRAAVEKWISTLCKKYSDKLALIDVVNEPFHAVPSYKNALGGNGITGWDWVINAFKLARKYAPSTAKLILNEYSVLQDYTITTNFINLINLLKDRGLIDAVGIQGHYFEFRSHVNATSGTYVYSATALRENLDRIAAIGLPIYVTEFDIDEAVDANQLAQMQIYFPVFWTSPAVKGITFWGYIQNDVWSSHPDTYLLLSDGTERPALQWLRTYVLKPIPPVLLSPASGDAVQRNPLLKWRSSKLATSYRVQITDVRYFASVKIDTTVADTVLQLAPLAANTMYFWRVSAVNSNGSSDNTSSFIFNTGSTKIADDQLKQLPAEFKLMQNYPNPFNPSTLITYQLPVSGYVTLKIYDQLGREVTTLVNEFQDAGINNAQFSIVNSQLSSGLYFYTLRAGNFMQTKKMILIK